MVGLARIEMDLAGGGLAVADDDAGDWGLPEPKRGPALAVLDGIKDGLVPCHAFGGAGLAGQVEGNHGMDSRDFA